MIIDRDGLYEIYVTLRQNKLRSFLTAFGVFWGILMLIVMQGTGRGLRNGIVDDFSRFATNAVYLWPMATSISYAGFPKGRWFQFNNADIEALKKNVPEIQYLAARARLPNSDGVNNVTRGLKTGTYNVYGDYPDVINIQLMDVVDGRFLNELDIQEKRKVAVIGQRVYEELFEAGESPVDQTIEIRGVYFQVIGVFTIENLEDSEDDALKTIFLPLSAFQRVFNTGERLGWFSLTSKPGVPAATVKDKAALVLKRNHQVNPDDARAIGFYNTEEDFEKVDRLFIGVNFLIWFVGICALLAGVIGVSNIMLIVVKEQTREIGIRRAIGATPRKIVTRIIAESVLITSISGYFGLFTGVVILEIVASITKNITTKSSMFSQPEVDFQMAIITLLVLIISGIFAGLIPAHRAITVKPVDAIRMT